MKGYVGHWHNEPADNKYKHLEYYRCELLDTIDAYLQLQVISTYEYIIIGIQNSRASIHTIIDIICADVGCLNFCNAVLKGWQTAM